MVAASTVYGHAESQAFQGKINYLTDAIKMALMAVGYTPNPGADTFWSDISANELTGAGYTAGGAAVPSPTIVETAANAWGLTWAATHAYVPGDVVKPAVNNGFLYMIVSGGGNSGGAAPAWPTVVGQTVVDSGVTWACMGTSITVFSSGSVSWAASAINAYFAVIYDSQTGVATTSPLINLQTFAGEESDSGGTFVVAPDSVYGWFYTFS
jgi:hypothetical protein